MAKGREVRKRGKSEGTMETAMAQRKGHNHQSENERDGKKERTTVRKFKLKRKELEGATITNRNLQPKKLKYNVQKRNCKENSRALSIPCFTPYTHMSNS
jgi:hypothetical protein